MSAGFLPVAGFWLEEAAAPYCVFVDAGYEVDIASPAGGAPPVDEGSKASLPLFQVRNMHMALVSFRRRNVFFLQVGRHSASLVLYVGSSFPRFHPNALATNATLLFVFAEVSTMCSNTGAPTSPSVLCVGTPQLPLLRLTPTSIPPPALTPAFTPTPIPTSTENDYKKNVGLLCWHLVVFHRGRSA